MQTIKPTEREQYNNTKKPIFQTTSNPITRSQPTTFLDEIRIQIYYSGIITVIYLKPSGDSTQNSFDLLKFHQEVKHVCKFDSIQPFTLKWVDEEGDPCTISSQLEFDESIRLYYINKESELVVHVFANLPERPGASCVGEDRSIYRRGARRWRKIYLVNGHKYQAKRFARTALCKVCQDRIWGLGRQGYKCLECKVMVHKRCHKFITTPCSEISNSQQQQQPFVVNRLENNSTSLNNNHDMFDNHSLRNYEKSFSNQSSNIKNSPSQTSLNNHANKSTHKNPTDIYLSTSPSLNLDQIKTSPESSNFSKQASVTSIIRKSKSRSSLTSTNKANTNSPKNLIPINYNEIEINSNNDSSINTKMTTSSNNNNNTRQMTLDDFNLIKVIGRGSYAKVFLVEYKKTQKCYAMKVIKKSLVNDDEDIDWVQTEKHVFEQASNHPFLVGLHSCFQTESRLFFVIEYLCGGDLMYHMQRKRKLPEENARFYAAEIVLALDFLHAKGIIYRDLKLDNVLLDIEGHIKLTDYGMCKEGLKPGEQTSTFCGTPNYIAPEMLRGESYDFSVDWWALGVLCFEMMAGRSPFEINENPSENPDLNTEDHLFQVILEKPIRIPRSLSVRATSLLKGFLQKLPSDRLGTRDGLREIEHHLFFKTIDWNLLEQRLLPPPYKPSVLSERDLNNIDELFTKEPVILTPDSPQTLARIQQNEFEGFEYVNPLILSEDLPV